MSELCFKDLFVMSMLVEYEQDRTKAVYIMSDLDWLVINKSFYVDRLVTRWDAYDEEVHFDVFSKNKSDWDDAIDEIKDLKEHLQSKNHQCALNIQINQNLLITWQIDKEHVL